MRPTARQLLGTMGKSLQGPDAPSRPRWTQVLDGDSLHVDFGGDGPVFRVTVEEVPRLRWAPEQPVSLGPVDGVVAQLVGVTVDNLVHVHLAVVPPAGGFPGDVADRLRRVQVGIADHLGTRYELASAEYGGTDHEEAGMQSFGPRPPVDAGQLALSLRMPGGLTVRLPVLLTRPVPSAR